MGAQAGQEGPHCAAAVCAVRCRLASGFLQRHVPEQRVQPEPQSARPTALHSGELLSEGRRHLPPKEIGLGSAAAQSRRQRRGRGYSPCQVASISACKKPVQNRHLRACGSRTGPRLRWITVFEGATNVFPDLHNLSEPDATVYLALLYHAVMRRPPRVQAWRWAMAADWQRHTQFVQKSGHPMFKTCTACQQQASTIHTAGLPLGRGSLWSKTASGAFNERSF